MNQEQLNMVADIFNESKLELIKSGEYVEKDSEAQTVVSSILSGFACYLYVYKDLFPDKYEEAKNLLQNITDLITLGVDVETCQPKDGEFSAEKQHLLYLGGSK